MTVTAYVHISLELWGSIFCLIAALILFIGRNVNKKQRILLVYMQLCNALLLISDSLAWFYRGNASTVGYYMVRISNMIVFILTYCLLGFFTVYVSRTIFSLNGDVQDASGICAKAYKKSGMNRRSKTVMFLCVIGILLVIISQFNHMYYYFDSHNFYHRNKYFFVSEILGISGMFINVTLLLQYRKRLDKQIFLSLLSYIVLPIVVASVQIFIYGISLLNIAITVAMLFMFLTEEVKQAELLVKRETEVNDMQTELMLSQIGPHFIFNCLTTIKYLCKTKPDTAAEAVDEFACYLRENIDAIGKRKCIPFEKELTHVKNYLSLEQKRFNERVKVEFDIQASEFELPSLTLQPIVENAVKHGIMKRAEGGNIKISSYSDENGYYITVEDDGVGFDSTVPKQDGKNHIGILNVRRRLETMCSGYLSIESTPMVGTKALVFVPRKSARGN